MKLFKRMAVASLAVAMAASSLVACGSKDTGNSDEVIKLDVYSQLANYSGLQSGWFGAVMKEKFNVELNIIPEADGSTYSTRMESGDLGDIVIFGASGDQYINAYEKGMLYDWNKNDLLSKYGSYINENMQAALAHNADISGGTTYGFGHNVATDATDHEQFFYSWDLRFDLYQEIGSPEIKDLDDLYDAFVAMKEICPTDENENETYAVSLWPDWDGNMVMYVKAAATAYYGYDELGLGLYNCETGEFYDALDKDGPYIAMIKFFNKLSRAGLLDPDSSTQNYTEMAAKVLKGRTFWSIFNYSGSSVYNTPDHIKEGKAMYSVTPTEASPIVYGMNVMGGNRVWTIGAKSEYPDLCMEIINYLCTPEGRLTMEYGPKGLTWDYDADGLTYFTELGKATSQNNKTAMTTDDAKYKAYAVGTFSDGSYQLGNTTWSIDATNPDSGEKYNYKYWASEVTEPASGSIEADWREWSGATSSDEYMELRGEDNYTVSLASAYTEGEKDADLEVTWKQVTEAIKTGTWNAILAGSEAECDELIDEMIKEANAYDNGEGYKKCVEWSENEAATRKAAEDAVTATTK